MSTVPPPYDDLPSDPYSAYPTTDLTKTKFPELSTEGLGRRGLWPFATFLIDAWHEWSPRDYYGFRLGDLTKPSASGEADTLQKQYSVNVRSELIPEGDNDYFARVVRVGSLQESRSATKKILCKQTIPGGEDRRIWEPWHSGYFMWLRDLTEGDILNPTVVQNGIWVVIQPYLNIRKNDVIMIYVDGILFEYVVSPAEAASKKPLEICIPAALFDQISLFGPIGIVFTVVDVVGNKPQGKYWLSKPIMLLSEMKPGVLDNPIFTLDGNESNQVDLDTLVSTIVCAVVVSLPRRPPAAPLRNQVVVIFETTAGENKTSIVRLPAVPDRNLRGETVPVNNALFKELAGSRVRIWFEWLSPAGAVLETSPSYLVTVFGTPTLMPALSLVPFLAGVVPPDTDVQATVPTYTPHDSTWLETVKCERMDPVGGGDLVTFKQLAGTQGGVRQLSKTSLNRFQDKGIFQVYYETDNGTGSSSAIRQSEKLDVEVGTQVADLTPIEIEHAKSGNIDLADVKGPETLMFITYDGTVNGDEVHVNVIGKDPQSSFATVIKVTKATEGPTFTTLGIPLSLSVLNSNLDGSIRVSYAVMTPGSPPTRLVSQVRDYTIGVPVVLKTLKILEANASAATIAPTNVLNGATLVIDYSQKRVDDVLRWKWNGQYDVSKVEGEIKVSSAAASITVAIPSEIVAMGLRPDGNGITVSCELIRGQTRYAFDDLKLVLLPLASLPTVRISGFGSATVLPVSQLTATTVIEIEPWEFMFIGQPVWMTCTGTRADGASYANTILIAYKVTAKDLVSGISVLVPLADMNTLQDGSSFRIEGSVSFPGIASPQTATPFGTANYLIQQLPAVLAHPTLNGISSTAQTVTVDPLTVQSKVSVTVAYAGMLVTDVITMQWIQWDGTQIPLTLKGATSGSVVFDFTSSQVLHNSVNSVVQLKYSIVRNGKTTSSNVQTVNVSTIAAPNMPRPLINNLASGATFHINSLTADALLTLPKWPLSKAGQRVWITLTCAGQTLAIRSAHAITAAEASNGLVNIPVSRNWLLGLPVNGVLSITGWVMYDGSAIHTRPVAFQSASYTANTRLRPPVITHVLVAASGRTVVNGGSVTAAEGNAIVVYGTCESRPYFRQLRMGPYAGGGYILDIPAGTTSWQTWAAFFVWPNPQDHYAIEESDKGVISAYHRIFRV
ncbi:hypothetical protein HX780_05790 [Pseudomonas tolaasii]|uniref:hypothetical protein n=1 Tax=Pseudomonas tolaasii TaxID=29442 RepID=UPI0015A18835|nr:hypothetical protein [Pseudomonas tolaasii]NVZ44942.1 hypothetical protein [Pseudomonas tolaasii]NWA47803.1 hypothetical protein [Pseudomonas tolaasii]